MKLLSILRQKQTRVKGGERIMKKILLGMAIVVLSMGVGSLAFAGEYHSGSQLVCSDCHTMHYSLQHDYSGGAAPSLPAGGPFEHLLKGSSTNNLCKSCHDAQTDKPDVVGTNAISSVREAGALNETGGTTPYETWKGHTLGYNGAPPGGSGSFSSFGCTNCHQPHGNSNYRNLSGTVTYAKGTNDLTKDILLGGWTLGSISTNYAVSNVDFNEPTATASAMGQFCKGCHTDFHGSSSSANMNIGGEWVRHPTADANITGGMLTQFSGKSYRVKVMSPTGAWGTQGSAWVGAPSDLTPTCISCHKAHGNQNPFGLIYLTGTSAITEEGNGTSVRDLCKQCHTQGG